MSHRIEYQWAAFHLPAAPLGLDMDRYLIAIEGGDNRTFSGPRGKRARRWDACMVGNCHQVLRQAVKFAGACEGGGLQPHGRRCTPENYIRRIRRLREEAATTTPQGYWRARLQADPAHPAVEALRRLGLEPRLEAGLGATRAIVEPSREHFAVYFELIDRHIDDLPAWCWFEVFGLPAS